MNLWGLNLLLFWVLGCASLELGGVIIKVILVGVVCRDRRFEADV